MLWLRLKELLLFEAPHHSHELLGEACDLKPWMFCSSGQILRKWDWESNFFFPYSNQEVIDVREFHVGILLCHFLEWITFFSLRVFCIVYLNHRGTGEFILVLSNKGLVYQLYLGEHEVKYQKDEPKKQTNHSFECCLNISVFAHHDTQDSSRKRILRQLKPWPWATNPVRLALYFL